MKVQKLFGKILIILSLSAGVSFSTDFGPLTPKNNPRKPKAKINAIIQYSTANLAVELAAGSTVTLKDSLNGQVVDGPRTLQAKTKKNGTVVKYFLKQKKDVTIIFKPKNLKLLYKVWTNLPASVMLVSSGGGTNLPIHTNAMMRIPAGTFVMGDSFSEGSPIERPVHSIYISAFNVDKYEVSNEEMRRVMQWAYDNGKITATSLTVRNSSGNQQELIDLDSPYSWISFSSGKFSVINNKENDPCIVVSWYGACAYSNFRSEIEGKTPCYNFTNWSCDWGAFGYRLPTEAEWEKAARGGVAGHRFPWSDSDTITHSRANYYSTNLYFYDVSTTSGYNPAYTNQPMPYKSPVGSFAPNGYGLCDVAGNVQEWCWDWYDGTWYSQPDATNANTRGPTSVQTYRVLRGGNWGMVAHWSKMSARNYISPNTCGFGIGFRCVEPTPDEMGFVPSGSYRMGSEFASFYESPIHSVKVSSFYIDKFEVSNEKMRKVLQWAYDNGLIMIEYSRVKNVFGDRQTLAFPSDISYTTNGIFTVQSGKENFPCKSVTWYGACAYANFLSQMKSRTPCYNFSDWSCNWNANGYRLPTEAEWEKAARGGLDQNFYPWPSAGGSYSDHINGSMANYWNSGDPYDNGTTPCGYYNGNQIPTGVDMANGYGLYDMAGNLWEWCWDWYSTDWYSDPAATVDDTRGPASGFEAVVCGGEFENDIMDIRCARRRHKSKDLGGSNFGIIGFRCVVR